MITHNLKVSFRNLLKYKVQTLISIVGLAVGFVCFAFSLMWIHAEMKYDAQHEGADRLYLFYKQSTTNYSGYDTDARRLLLVLRDHFPEVEQACGVSFWKNQELQTEDGTTIKARKLIADSTFMKMFHVRILAGTPNFLWTMADERQRHLYDESEPIAVTEETALRLYGTTDVIGKTLKAFGDATICAVVSGLPQSSLSFDFWSGTKYSSEWNANPLLFRLREGTDLAKFRRKLDSYKESLDGQQTTPFKEMRMMPLREYHYSDVNEDKTIKFNYLILFSVIGLMVILGALFNYLSLFVSRMQMRSREIELRQVCGSSRRQLFGLFTTEYALVLLLAGLLGFSLAEASSAGFRALSGIEGSFYGPLFLFFVGLLLVSLLMLLPFILHRHRWNSVRSHAFRRFGILFQVATGILFIFAAIVIMKQLRFLQEADLGWERKDVAILEINKMKTKPDFENFHDAVRYLEQMPCVNEIIGNHTGVFAGIGRKHSIDDWEGKTPDEDKLRLEVFFEGETIARFYNLQLKEGRMPNDTESGAVVLNEAAVRRLQLSQPVVGQHLTLSGNPMEIVGVLKDFHVTAPTVPVFPMAFIGENGLGIKQGPIQMYIPIFLIKFKEGHWEELLSRTKQMAQELNIQKYSLQKTEDIYADYLKSENLLLKLLAIASAVCVIIAAFGIFSLVTLSCEQRRKEIAVRKVNGATVRDILLMFVREYFSMLVLASVVAFPIGYVLMKRWIENYMEQTAISVWIYLGIFAGIALVIALCIGWRVWQAARQNPAEVIKSE